MGVFTYKTHIRYQDIDADNKLSNKGILNILSEAAGLHSEKVGYSVNEIEKTGYSWMILNWNIKAMKRPRWDTEVVVKTWPRKFEKVSSWRDFEMYDNNGELIVIGSSEWVLIDVKKQRISRITDEMCKEYGIVPKSVFEEECDKLKEGENMQKVYEYIARRRDIDSNQHVNNIVYLDFAYDAFPENVDLNFDNVQIFYKKQIKLRREYICILLK